MKKNDFSKQLKKYKKKKAQKLQNERTAAQQEKLEKFHANFITIKKHILNLVTQRHFFDNFQNIDYRTDTIPHLATAVYNFINDAKESALDLDLCYLTNINKCLSSMFSNQEYLAGDIYIKYVKPIESYFKLFEKQINLLIKKTKPINVTTNNNNNVNDNYEPNSTTPALANLGTDYLSKLPLDILITIFMFLDLKSLKTAYKVSKFFNTLSTKTNHFSSEITYVTQYCHQVVEQQGWIASITFDKQLNVKEVITNKLVFVSEINEKYNHMSVIAISNDKKYIAVAHEKTNLYHRGIDLYDLVDKKFLYCFKNDVLNATHTYISALDFLPDNSFIFAIGDAIFRYSLQNNTLTCIDTIYGVKSIQYGHDKNALIFSGYHIVIHDLNSYFNNQKISKNRVLSEHFNLPKFAYLSNDNKYLVCANGKKNPKIDSLKFIIIYDLLNNRVVKEIKSLATIESMILAADGKYVLTKENSNSKTFCNLYDLSKKCENLIESLTFPGDWIINVFFTPKNDGIIIICLKNIYIKFFNPSFHNQFLDVDLAHDYQFVDLLSVGLHLEDGGEILLSDFLEPISNEAQDDTITNITELSANNLLSTFGFLSQKEIDVEEMGINAEFTDITKDVDESGAEFFPPLSPHPNLPPKGKG